MQSHAIRQRANIALAFASVLLVALALQVQNAFAQAISSNARYSCDFNGTYCDFIEQSKLGDAPPDARRSSLVSNVSRSGGQALRLHTEPGDTNVHGSGDWERNDVLKTVDSSYCNEGQEEWWAVSVMFPSDYVFPPGPGAGIIMDFHHNGSGGQANYEVQTIPGIGLRARGYGGSTVNQGQFDALIPDPYGAVNNVTRNVWYDFVFHARWSSSGNGLMEGWLNGRKFQSYNGATLYSGVQCYLKLANYHAPFGQPSSIIYDRVVRGTSATDVAIGALEGIGGAGSPVATPTTATYTLSAAISGNGRVTSSPAGMSCTSNCSASFASGSVVTLSAAPASGATFAGWSGACSGTGMCSISIGGNQSVTASFTGQSATPAPTGSLAVSGGIDASAYSFTAGTSVSFTTFVNGNAGTPGGTIAFTDNGGTLAGCAAVPMSGGKATCTTSSLGAGSHAIRGSYSGDSTYGAGVMGPITATVSAAATGSATTASAYNVQGLWWQPSEAGWGVNLSHQGGTLFATWFTYDAQGKGQWLVMSNGDRVGDNAYSGALYRTTGPSYQGAAFDASSVRYTQVGTAYFTFTDANNGTFVANVDGATFTKAVTRYVYANSVPTCTQGSDGYTTNFQDLWWRAGGTESGWGVNVVHQGSVLFATLFTYDTDGSPMWIEGSSLAQVGDGTFSGAIDQTSGPALNSAFDPSKVTRAAVGNMTIAFTDPANGTLTYTLNGTTITKPIQRFVYATPATTCH
jgi:hypothetical protein